MIAEKVANLPVGNPNFRKDAITKNLGIAQTDAAKQFNVSDESIRQARKVRTDAIPEVADAVESGGLTHFVPQYRRSFLLGRIPP